MKVNLHTLILNMTTSMDKNISLFNKVFEDIHYRDDENQSLLHLFVDKLDDEYGCLWAVKTLLKMGVNPNLKDEYGYNFIQTALYAGFKEEFILNIIKEALNYGLDINHVDDEKDTIMHTVIYSDDYRGEIINIYKLLVENGFDSNVMDIEKRNLLEAIKYQNDYFKNTFGEYMYTEEQIREFEKYFYIFKLANLYTANNQDDTKDENMLNKDSNIYNDKLNTKSNKDKTANDSNTLKSISDLNLLNSSEIEFLEQHGRILNKKIYKNSPTIGRELELENLIISLASDKKQSILVGKSGVGKTSIVDELAYRIINNMVPRFLQGKVLLEINPSKMVSGTKFVGEFEEKMTKLMNFCYENGIIVFIDEIHTIYGLGAASGKDNDMANILKYYIDRTGIKVIGTTTVDNYNKYFSNNDLARRFDKIEIKEPSNEVLFQILDKVVDDYCINSNLMFKDEFQKEEIIKILINTTDSKHRRYDDTLFNPDLAISIIDKAFAYAKVYDYDIITEDNFIKSMESNDRLYLPVKEKAIYSLNKLKSLNPEEKKVKSKVLKVDFTKKKRI